ncbi:MAG TPA: metallophosphoesterase [Thermoanaerobaculia bacterium]|nr:metallophosphoesterase [Thermoanaerobaculia bacterium]
MTVAALERSRIRRTLLACALGSTLPALCLAQTAQTAGMPPLPPLARTAALAAAADPSHFTFVVAGDDRPATETATPTATIVEIFAEVAKLKPAFMLMLGDTVYGKDDKDQTLVAQEYQQFLQLAAGAGVPVFNAPGNHEMDDKHDHPSSIMESWYRQDTESVPYGAFTFGNSRFIALNTDDLPGSSCAGTGAQAGASGKAGKAGKTGKAGAAGKAAKAGKKKFAGDLGTTQLSQLAADLAGDTAITNVFILMHRPIYAQKASSRLTKGCRNELETLFAKYPNVRFVLASHEHLFYQPAKLDHPAPPAYLVSGGAGAPLATGGFYNYLVFTVDGSQVTWKMVKPGSSANAAR